MSAPIDYAALAELAEALDLPGAAHLRASAESEREDPDNPQAELDAVYEVLNQVPEPTKSTKHSDGCWQQHAHCLVERITGGTE